MDGLSAVASIASLVTAADTLFLRVYRYIHSVRKADKEIHDYCTELQLFAGVLHRLNLQTSAINSADGTTDDFRHALISTFNNHIDEINKKIEKCNIHKAASETAVSRSRSVSRITQKLKWPFSKDDIKDMIMHVERFRGVLESALATDSIRGIKQLLDAQNHAEEELHRVEERVLEAQETLKEKVQSLMRSKEHQDVLQFFGVSDAFQRHDQSCDLRSEDTGTWLIDSDEYTNWLNNRGSKLWCFGIPGAGKTILAGLAIEKTRKSTQGSAINHAIAYFYCDYKDAQTQQPQKILGTIAAQIAAQSADAFKILRDLYETQHTSAQIRDPKSNASMIKLIKDLCGVFDDVSIIVDGLDECGSNVIDLTKHLRSLNNEDGSNIRILLFSRDEQEIRTLVEVEFEQVDIVAQSSDLRRYVAAEVQRRTEDGRLEFNNPALKEKIMDSLVAKASGMFRWVSCQIDYLCSLPNDRARREALSDLPPDLNSTYERMLDRIDRKTMLVRTLVRDTLRWLVLCKEPLATNSLREALAISCDTDFIDEERKPSESSILRNCGSFVRRSADWESIELAHFTVQEFLEKDVETGDRYPFYRINNDVHTLDLARCCLTYINYRDFRSPCADFEAHEARCKQYPFWQHAVRHWCDYGLKHFNDESLLEASKPLFEPEKPSNLLSWFQAYSASNFKPDIDDKRRWFANDCIRGNASPLHYAAMVRFPGLVKWLLGLGCNVNQETSVGTPLHCCLAMFNDDRNPRSSQHNTRISFTARLPDIIATVDNLLEVGADSKLRWRDDVGMYHSTLELVLDAQAYQVDNDNDLDMWVTLVRRILNAGAVIDEACLQVLRATLEEKEYVGAKILSQIEPHHIRDSALTPYLDQIRYKWDTEARRLLESCTHTIDAGECLGHLRTASQFNEVQVVQKILNTQKLNVNASDAEFGKTALHIATENESVDVVTLLLNAGASVDVTDIWGQTPLHYCAGNAAVATTEKLVKKGIRTGARDSSRRTVWHAAAAKNNHSVLELLLSTLKPNLEALSDEDENGHTAFFLAAFNPGDEAFQLLTHDTTHVNQCSSHGLTIAHLCSQIPPHRVAKMWEIGVDFSRKTPDGSTALHCLMEALDWHNELAGAQDKAELLVEYGVDPSAIRENGESALHVFLSKRIHGKYGSKISKLLGTDSIINHLSLAGFAPLHIFLEEAMSTREESALDVFHVLIARGARTEQSNSFGRSALATFLNTLTENRRKLETPPISTRDDCCAILASMAGSAAFVDEYIKARAVFCALWLRSATSIEKLIRSGAQMNIPVEKRLRKNKSTFLTSFEIVCLEDLPESLFRVVTEQAPPDGLIKNNQGSSFSLLHTICSSESETPLRHLKILLDRGMDINTVSSLYGRTPLIDAIICRKDGHAMLLLERGASVDQLDKDGWSAIHFAAKSSATEVLGKILSKHGDSTKWDLRVSWSSTQGDNEGETVHECSLLHLTSSAETAQLLFEKWPSCEINVRNTKNETPLHISVRSARQISLVRYLLSHGAEVNAISNSGSTPLHFAVSDRDIFEELLRNNALIDVADKEGNTALHEAARAGTCDVVTALLNNGAQNLSNRKGLRPSDIAFVSGHTKLSKLLEYHYKNYDSNSLTVEGDSRPTERSTEASKALNNAITEWDYGLCKDVAAMGKDADRGSCGYRRCTPVINALRCKSHWILDLLMRIGFAFDGESCGNASCGNAAYPYASSLHLAVYNHVTDVILRHVLTTQVDSDPQLLYQYHPLHLALVSGNLEGLTTLLRYYEETLKSGSRQFIGQHDPPTSHRAHRNPRINPTALDLWALQGRSERVFTGNIIDVPVQAFERTLNPMRIDQAVDGSTPLHIAAQKNDHKSAAVLLFFGASIDSRDRRSSFTPLHVAAYTNSGSVVSLLLDAGANVEARDSQGATPILLAVFSGHEIIFRQLLEHGADLGAKCFRGYDIFYMAHLGGDTSILAFLLSSFLRIFEERNPVSLPEEILCERHSANFRSMILNYPTLARRLHWVNVESFVYGKNHIGLLKMVLKAMKLYNGRTQLFKRPFCSVHASPMAHVIAISNIKGVKMFIEAGIDLNADCCDVGSPLVLACTNGLPKIVEILLYAGGSIAYVRDGTILNAVQAAQRYPSIQHFLLVGRYTKQPKLTRSYADGNTQWGSEQVCKPWSGPQPVELQLTGRYSRFNDESRFEYAVRLGRVRESFTDRQIGFGPNSEVFVLELGERYRDE